MRRILACRFGDDEKWERMAAVLEKSAKLHHPTYDVRVEKILPRPYVSPVGSEYHEANTKKLDWWNEQIQKLPDGEEVVLMDTDTFFLQPIDPIWEREFDIAVTDRETGPPIDAGVIYLRTSSLSRFFMDEWLRVNVRLFQDPQAHAALLHRYGGVNQAAMADMAFPVMNLIHVPCAVWNDCMWRGPISDVKVVHAQWILQMAIFGMNVDLTPLEEERVKAWKELEG